MLYQEEILKTLMNYPQIILENDIEAYKDKEFLQTLKRRAGIIEASIEADVLGDSKKDEWKEALSNQTKRDREKQTRLGMHEEYKTLQEEINDKERELIMKEFHNKHNERVWQSAKAAAYLQAR